MRPTRRPDSMDPIIHDRRLRHQIDLMEADKTRSQVLKLAGFVVGVLALALFMIHMIMAGTRPGPKLYVVRTESIREAVPARALILRDEQALHAPEAGIFHPVAAEGTRHPAGSLIGLMVDTEDAELVATADDLADRISERRIALIQTAANPDLLDQHFGWDPVLLGPIDQLRAATRTGDVAALRDSEVALDTQIHSRSFSDLTLDYGDEELRALIDEYTATQARLHDRSAAVTLPTAGYVSFGVDPDRPQWTLTDYPSALAPTPTPPERYTPGSYPNVVQAPPGATLAPEALAERLDRRDTPEPPDAPVSDGTRVARLITGAWQELHVLLPERGGWTRGERYDLTVTSDGLTIEGAELTGVYPADSGYHLVFRTDRQVEALAGRDVVSTEIVSESPTGLAIPLEALITEPRATALDDRPAYGPRPPEIDTLDLPPEPVAGRTSVYRLESGYIRQIPVEVLRTTQSFALIRSPEDAVNPIRDGNIIILNPESSQGGERIGR